MCACVCPRYEKMWQDTSCWRAALFNALLSVNIEEYQWDSTASLALTKIAIMSTESSATASKLNMFTEKKELFFKSLQASTNDIYYAQSLKTFLS